MSVFSSSAKVAGKAAAGTSRRTATSTIRKGFDLFTTPVPRVLPNAAKVGDKAYDKMVNKSVNNLYMGFKLKAPVQAALAVGALGVATYGAAETMFNNKAYGRPYDNTQQTGMMPRLSGPPDMGATGDLTLALNRRR